MPQPRKPSVTGRVPDDAERAKIQRSITGNEQSPSSRSQSTTWVSWKDLGKRLGQPFDAEQIPYSKLRQMRRDPMISFGLHYVKTPLVRAKWRIEADDPQVAAFIDAAWRRIHARFMFQRALALDFGFVPIVKRFEEDFPQETYRPRDNPDTLTPIWSEGSVPAIMWKPFVAIPPELAEPVWDEATGELAGMNYSGPEEQGRALGGGGNSDADIDIYHTLWGTNERDSVFGSLYGYPRIAYAYRYWWSYWFRWAMYDRYFERTAVPPLMVWHPEGVYEDPVSGEQVEFADIAFEAGNRARSNGIITMPSDLADGGPMGSAGGQRAWEIKYLDGGQTNVDFDDSFNYLDVMKLRSMWVPEQAFIEGEGGTSSRNVAAQMAEIFVESQANLMAEIDDEINRFIIPQLVVTNFPEYEGDVRKVSSGFSEDDTEFVKQIIQLIGQGNPAALGVDVKTEMERLGFNILSPEQQAQQQSQLLQQAPAPATAEPAPGAAGVIEDPASATGFSYVGHPEVIQLSDRDDFIASLPSSRHFSDERTRKAAAQLRSMYRSEFRERIKDLARKIEEGDLQIDLSDVELVDVDAEVASEMELAEEGSGADSPAGEAVAAVLSAVAAKRVAGRIVDSWTYPQERLADLGAKTAGVLGKIMKYAFAEVGDRTGLPNRPGEEDTNDWTRRRAEEVVVQTDRSLRDEAVTALANALVEGKTEPKLLARELRSSFSERPASKSDTVAVTETVGAWNMATLMAAGANEVKQVQAIDAQKGPTDRGCEERDGKIFTVKAAVREDEKDRHPNCTLEWRILEPKVELSMEFTDGMDPNQLAHYDQEEQKVWFSEDSSHAERKRYLKALGRTLEATVA